MEKSFPILGSKPGFYLFVAGTTVWGRLSIQLKITTVFPDFAR
jgi:hypothetical protein